MLLLPEPVPPITILIVEDEFLIADDLQAILENAGYQVTGVAESVVEAQEMATQQPPSIVLLDIFLVGDATGIDLARWLGERNIPFVFLSANLTDNILAAAKVTQPFGFLNKPFREKDVLTTLELARYRHAHSAEAKLRQQREIQMAVNNAIVTIHDRDQLSRAIAVQLNKLAPFSLLNLRIGLPEEDSFYWVMLRKATPGTFERIHLPALLGTAATDTVLEKATREAPDQLGEQPGIFTGPAFDHLCAHYLTARASRDNFGVRSLALFPVRLNRRSSTTLHLASTAPNGFTPQEYDAVNLVIPQIALALDNLLASEEKDARRQLKAAELTVVSAFQNGKALAEIATHMAIGINKLMPIDLFRFHSLNQAPENVLPHATIYKQDGLFAPLAEPGMRLPNGDYRPVWHPSSTGIEMALAYPTLAVGEQADTASARSVISQLFGDRLGLQSSMWVPVLSKSQPIAALILASSAAYAFTTKDVRTLQELSGRVALALENLLAFEHITRLNEQLRQEKTYLSEEIRAAFHFEEFIGTSPALLTVVERVNQAGPSDYPVLVIGETGTGKEFIARAVHNASRRKGQALIKVICTALSPQLLAAEIFGQEFDDSTPASERRIGKLELAHAGSLFLDEVGELPLELQAELLGAMQTKKIARLGGQTPIAVDVRIIAATSRDLSQEVVAGRFLPDLYYLLNSGLIEAPTLRQRSDDIPLLAMHFLPQISKKLGKTITSISDSALYQLKRYAWPGNIRELQQVLERMAMLSPAPTLELAEPLATFRLPPTSAPPTGMVRPLHEAMREAILAALAQSRHRIRGAGGAAELLGIKPTTLEARMKKLRIGPGQSLS